MTEAGVPVRIGILGAARVAPAALIKPARESGEVMVVAVAARDRCRAQAFADEHAISRVYENYHALVADPNLDAVYIPLPNSLHGRWIRAALGAGKHVLCEKPFTANAQEAREIATLAAESGLVVMNGFHYRHHPFAERVQQTIASGELGKLERVEGYWCHWLPKFSHARYDYSLGGGSVMDLGCYAVDMVRVFGGSTPEVVAAQAKLHGPQIDRAMTAQLRFADGVTGSIHCSMWSSARPQFGVKLIGDRGVLRLNPLIPFQRFSVRSANGKRSENFGVRTTYAYQLDAFAAAVLRGEAAETSAQDAIETMTVIDGIYRAAGLEPRQPS
ncbi:Gfo/Idh/MocA family protein [Mycolicibacterium sarraceniae]|uniref:Oxidoreductase n=1 Tax=Mycolicibacterium sarraceniae TaxID=1534348 RepID=A0A7I7SS10_9MYCO|nr:Gfo/Idh/MocA family oxidoreductase [Mycolicibacterium sarraceniae]BBY59797.1 oxidoreductase [Mycolicibacterium sarraceniae]